MNVTLNFRLASGGAPRMHLHCDVRASFAVAFGAWRQAKQVPLKKIARDLGVSIGTVSAWELGRRFPESDNFQLLVEYTGLPPCRLLCVKAEQCVPSRCLLALGQLRSGEG